MLVSNGLGLVLERYGEFSVGMGLDDGVVLVEEKVWVSFGVVAVKLVAVVKS